MNKVGFNIRKIREKKGYSQEYMAQELEISQATYARIENQATRLTVERLYQIAEILNTDIAEFFNASQLTIQHQENQQGSYGNGYVQNLHVENKEVYEKLIETLESQVNYLKERLKLYEN
ncbi:helix-turn-helix transcriptional regulator [Weeksellaceae bacterium TAE3-ERU29]|nr:helix-turn-helix transcriptional regulator [Weeksellaceae bacterium TAE3-ERU29]